MNFLLLSAVVCDGSFFRHSESDFMWKIEELLWVRWYKNTIPLGNVQKHVLHTSFKCSFDI